ncbi:MAG TPA: DUF1326 domain-containing protein [Vicinamibacterales bacterium]|jgi:hypothetical protein
MTDKVSRRAFLQVAAAGAAAAGVDSYLGSPVLAAQARSAAPAWSMNATIIEACSCAMFCPCYFSTVPTGHGHGDMVEHFCRFNMAYRVNQGTFKGVPLAGLKFWIAGDLGADFSKGAEWAEITFEPSAKKEQREAITTIIPNVYPVTWKAFTMGKDAPIAWNATKDHAEAKLDAGKAAHIVLNRNAGMTPESTVIANLRYFGAPRNRGFLLMPNESHAYRMGSKPFEYKGTTGFMITYDINSKDIKT